MPVSVSPVLPVRLLMPVKPPPTPVPLNSFVATAAVSVIDCAPAMPAMSSVSTPVPPCTWPVIALSRLNRSSPAPPLTLVVTSAVPLMLNTLLPAPPSMVSNVPLARFKVSTPLLPTNLSMPLIVSGIDKFVGSSGVDTLNLASGTLLTMDGGAGNNVFNISGTADVTTSVSGGAGDDLFNLDKAITGQVQGGTGVDTLEDRKRVGAGKSGVT